MTTNINVNLAKCTCGGPWKGGGHVPPCLATPVPIPCPISRSVTFEVRVGECTCGTPFESFPPQHTDRCPARPIRVSISGKTWKESHVADVEGRVDGEISDAEWTACEELWALVKALALGENWDRSKPGIAALFEQRDAVFAALADMARAEESALQAQQRFYEACPIVLRTERRGERPSVGRLAAYVEHLIEQVGAL